MSHRQVVALLILAPVIGCSSRDQPPDAPVVVPAPNPRNAKIPVEVSYPIIRDEDSGNIGPGKRMVDVRLNMKVSPEVLREIALEVKSKEPRQYERTFVFIYLPEKVADVKVQPWATCHFNPTLDVRILGLTKEAEEALVKTKIDHAGKELGAWLIEMQSGGHIALLFQDGNRLKLAEVYPGGDRSDSDMMEMPSQLGRRFKKLEGTEVYEIGDGGVLRLHSDDGRVFTAAMPLR